MNVRSPRWKNASSLVLRDLVAEPDAAAALDAPLLIEHHVRAEVDRLVEGQLRLDVPALAGAVLDRVILELALPRLVADRAVERVVDEEELHHRRPGGLHLVAVGANDHSIRNHGRAGDDELRCFSTSTRHMRQLPAIDSPGCQQ
jgi:hypothetical protein